jgi:hypothetical protein
MLQEIVGSDSPAVLMAVTMKMAVFWTADNV